MATKKLYRDEAAEDLREFNRLGLPLAEQAGRLGVSVRAVQNARMELGLTTPRKPTVELTPELDALLKRAVEEGWSREEAARTTGISLRRLRRDYPELSMSPEERGVLGNTIRNHNRTVAGRKNNTMGGAEPFRFPVQ